MNQMERAVDEDKAGQAVLRSVEAAERAKRVKKAVAEALRKAPPLGAPIIQQGLSDMFIRELGRSCSTEDSHDFDSTGQCRRCGAHRRPA